MAEAHRKAAVKDANLVVFLQAPLKATHRITIVNH